MTTFGRIIFCLLSICAVIAAAYQPAIHNQLVWDDLHTVVHAERYRELNGSSLRWMFSTTLGGHYQPLTWLSFAIDHRIWGGLSASGMHVTNALLHCAGAGAFFLVALEILRHAGTRTNSWSLLLGATAATLWWAVHPLRVESVAWVTERRDVLSGVWLTLTVLLYLLAAREVGRRSLWLTAFALVCYIASLLSKAAGITLPLLLLLFDFFPLRRLQKPWFSANNLRIAFEKLLFAVPAVLIALIALAAQSEAGALRTFGEHPIALRVMQAFYGLAFYVGKIVWPSRLLPLYEQDPSAAPWDAAYVLSAATVTAATAFALATWRRWPGLLAAWAAYVILLLPVLGLAQSGPQLVADRYTYLAAMPLAVLVGWCLARLMDRTTNRPVGRATVGIALIVLLAVCLAQTRSQVRVWRDEYTLWSTVVERAPATGMAQANLAVELNRRGEYTRAIEHAGRALARLPGNRAAHRARGMAALQLGDFTSAGEHLAIAVRIADDIAKPDAGAMVGLAAANGGLSQTARAKALYERAISLEPQVAEWEFQYGSFLAGLGEFDSARGHLQRAIILDPSQAVFHLRLGIVEQKLANDRAAIDALQHGLQLDSRSIELRSELAWVLATTTAGELRNAKRALDLAREVIADSSSGSGRAREACAAAHAAMGDYASAAEIVQAELNVSPPPNPARLARLQRALELYRRSQPYHD
jgi:tetratricopeptide (TPR) repeat protein